MGNKLDIQHEYEESEKQASDLKDVCEKINNSARCRHLLEEYEKKHKEEVFLKYKELNEALFKVGYIPVTFSDFVHALIETGVKGFSVEEYVNTQLNS